MVNNTPKHSYFFQAQATWSNNEKVFNLQKKTKQQKKNFLWLVSPLSVNHWSTSLSKQKSLLPALCIIIAHWLDDCQEYKYFK